MKKIIISIIVVLSFTACNLKYEYNLGRMGEALKYHFRLNDKEQNIKTTLDVVRPISYELLSDEQKQQPEDKYLTKIYVRGKWYREGSSLIYNMDDTMVCYFDKNLNYLRLKEEKTSTTKN